MLLGLGVVEEGGGAGQHMEAGAVRVPYLHRIVPIQRHQAWLDTRHTAH